MENENKCPWCGCTDINLDSIEDSFFDNFILSSSYTEKKEE